MWQTVEHYVWKIYNYIFFIRNVRQFATFANGFCSKSLPLVNIESNNMRLTGIKNIYIRDTIGFSVKNFISEYRQNFTLIERISQPVLFKCEFPPICDTIFSISYDMLGLIKLVTYSEK